MMGEHAVGRSAASPLGVVFDCDGVLVDSEPLHETATRQFFATRGVTVSSADIAELVGMRVRDQVECLARRVGLQGDPDGLYRARERCFWQLAGNGVPGITGAADLVRRLAERGHPVAVATSGTRRWLDHVVDLLGLRPHLWGAIAGDEVHHPKPHPEAYLRAANVLRLPPEVCVAVEDSARGIASARAAGMEVVALNRLCHEPSAFLQADHVISRLESLTKILSAGAHRPATLPS